MSESYEKYVEIVIEQPYKEYMKKKGLTEEEKQRWIDIFEKYANMMGETEKQEPNYKYKIYDYENEAKLIIPHEMQERYYDYILSRTSKIIVEVKIHGYISREKIEGNLGRKLNKQEEENYELLIKKYSPDVRYKSPNIPSYKTEFRCNGLRCTGLRKYRPFQEPAFWYEWHYIDLGDKIAKKYFENIYNENRNLEYSIHRDMDVFEEYMIYKSQLVFLDKEERVVSVGGIFEIYFHSEEQYNEFMRLGLMYDNMKDSGLKDGRLLEDKKWERVLKNL